MEYTADHMHKGHQSSILVGQNNSERKPGSSSAFVTEAFSFLQSNEYSAYSRYPPLKKAVNMQSSTDNAKSNDVIHNNGVTPQNGASIVSTSASTTGKYSTNIVLGSGTNANNSAKHHGVYTINSHSMGTGKSNDVTWNSDYIDSPKDDIDSDCCCSKKRCLITLVVILILIVIAGVLAAVFTVILPGEDTLSTPTTSLPTTASQDSYENLENIIRLNESWNSDLGDPMSSAYLNLSTALLTVVSVGLDDSEYAGAYSLSEVTFREGSILAVFQAFFLKPTSLLIFKSVLVEIFVNLQMKGQLIWSMNPEEDIDVHPIIQTSSSRTTQVSSTPQSSSQSSSFSLPEGTTHPTSTQKTTEVQPSVDHTSETVEVTTQEQETTMRSSEAHMSSLSTTSHVQSSVKTTQNDYTTQVTESTSARTAIIQTSSSRTTQVSSTPQSSSQSSSFSLPEGTTHPMSTQKTTEVQPSVDHTSETVEVTTQEQETPMRSSEAHMSSLSTTSHVQSSVKTTQNDYTTQVTESTSARTAIIQTSSSRTTQVSSTPQSSSQSSSFSLPEGTTHPMSTQKTTEVQPSVDHTSETAEVTTQEQETPMRSSEAHMSSLPTMSHVQSSVKTTQNDFTTQETEATSARTEETTTKIYTETKKRTTLPPATCEALADVRCRDVGGTSVGFPNALKQTNQEEASASLKDFLYFATDGCYDSYSATLYSCYYLFPQCDPATGKLILPCRSFCRDFVDHCQYPTDCSLLPEDDANCIQKPQQAVNSTYPPYISPCSGEELLCGNDVCVSNDVVCNDVDDCGDYTDEIDCGQNETVLDCNFEEEGLCEWSLNPASHYNWTIHRGTSMTPATGPRYDHTHRSTQGGYLLAESSGQIWQDIAILTSSPVHFNTLHCFRFFYYMYGSDVDELKVTVHDVDSGEDEVAFSRRRNFGEHWRHGQVELPAGTTVTVSITAYRGSSHLADIAIDDLTARPGACSHTGCSSDEVTCRNDICLPMSAQCDRRNDCGDFSDEISCECTSSEFRCDMGICIPLYQRCDTAIQCPDSSDEVDCVCPLGQYSCSNGTCIMSEWLCDGEVDCPSGEDEQDCGSCSSEQFECSTAGCVDKMAVCDGVADCSDASDEHTCIRQKDGVVELYRDGSWIPVCAEGLPPEEGASICKHMGYKGVAQRADVSVASISYAVYDESLSPDFSFLQKFQISDICTDSRVLTIQCLQAECGIPKFQGISSLIVNGRDADVGEWPWHAGLYVNNLYTCGGSLISQRHVLTAAHCLTFGNAPSAYRVILGSIYRIDPDVSRITVNVENVVVHEDYDVFYRGDDIAILTLAMDVEFNDFIQPICLPHQDDIFPLTSLCYTSGWGKTDFDDDLSQARVLQEGKSRLWSDKKCQETYAYVDERFQCAGYDSGHIANCPGDSGGPLVCRDHFGRWSQVGVFSFIRAGCNVPLFPPVFTRTQAFLSWIDEHTTCQFTCDNGDCLWNINNLCNGKDDCGDSSDEIRPCSGRGITCSFDDVYACGYTQPKVGPLDGWTRKRKGSTNVGPLVDRTKADGSGYFMYGADGISYLVAPLYHSVTQHCFRFRYHLRSAFAGTLYVFTVPVNDSSFVPSNVDLADRNIIFNVDGNYGDLWYEVSLDLPAATLVIGFESRATGGSLTPAVAVDDVELLPGNCSSQECRSDQGVCYDDGSCYEALEDCNYRVYCVDESDEVGCGEKWPYICDFEKYGLCGLEQTVEDGKDWSVERYDPDATNGPVEPPSGPGRYVYMSTMTAGTATMSLPVHTPDEPSCFKFNFTMKSEGTLRFRYLRSSSIYVPAWSQLKANHSGWNTVSIAVPVGTRLITIDGIPGSNDAMNGVGFIAMDDFEITTGECEKPECGLLEWRCDDGSCIDSFFKCDGYQDCDDYSDESDEHCKCWPDAFLCDDGFCLQGHVRCNGVDNCYDNSDEISCSLPCEDTEYACLDGQCKHRSTWCDGIPDCNDGSDELPTCECFPEQLQCADREQCISGFRKCDGVIDCKDGSDEPPGCTCDDRWHFKCVSSGKCIPKEFRCNGVADCSDSSDEHCNCSENEFRCSNGNCIDASLFCNGLPDCMLGEDEPPNCECAAGLFKCTAGGCIQQSLVCNDVHNCYDKSDEHSQCVCRRSQFQCADGLCINSWQMCNGIADCDDGADEADCSCTVGQFECASGMCISAVNECDGQDQCGDESDEQVCSSCRAQEHRCPEGRCIQLSWVCDGFDDCLNGTEEDNCGSCLAEQWQCKNYDCIPKHNRCDGFDDCADLTDESRCFRLQDGDGNSGELLYAYHVDDYYPVCASNWRQSWSDDICLSLGQGTSALVTAATPLSSASEFLAIPQSWTGTSYNLSIIQKTSSCANNEAVRLVCESALCGQAVSSPSPYIIGGDVAGEGSWPWAAALLYLGAYRCSGTVINEKWILTAAHCFIHTNGYSLEHLPHYFTVRLGSVSLNQVTTSVVTAAVKAIFIHPTYFYRTIAGMQYEDIALIELNNTLTFSERIRPACLPSSSQSFSSLSLCYAAGWGFTSLSSTTRATDLREARLSLRSTEQCSSPREWGGDYKPQTQICAGYTNGYIATCLGDSGGGLACRDENNRWSVIGITSVGPSSCGQVAPPVTAKPGIFTKVVSYLPWIQSVLDQG